jgi:hypothetical protein
MIAQAGAECSSANVDTPPAALMSLMTFWSASLTMLVPIASFKRDSATALHYVRDRHVVSIMVSKSEYLGLKSMIRSAREASATSVAGSPGRLAA